MKKHVLTALNSALHPILKNRVYIARAGLVAGLKRRGGYGFIPKRMLSLEHEFLKNLDLKGKTVYDVGGHIGLLTIFFARAVGQTGRIITFEPNPQNYKAIIDHVELNGFTNVKVIPMGLSNKRETLKFVVGHSAQGTAAPDKQEHLLEREGVKITQIEVDTLDNLIVTNDLPKPDFVKIDVEGLELKVLQGMSQIITDYRPEMHIELHGVKEREVIELLLSYHYNLYQIEDDINITQQNIDKVRGHQYAH